MNLKIGFNVQERFKAFVLLSDKDTYAELAECLDFETREYADIWVNMNYPDWIRCDVFHGLQEIIICKVIRRD